VLVLCRHGRTAANAAGVLLGRADPPLDERGSAQATALPALVGRPARVVSSPLLRARQTAAALGLPVEIDERWIELDYGELDERPLADIPGSLWARWRADPGFAPPGGESLSTLGARVRSACDELADEVAVADVVVVSHVSPIKAAVAWAVGAGDDLVWRLHLAPASVTRIAVRPTGPVLVSFNVEVAPSAPS
jgi:broad specificity phosphatase PhoE